MGADVDAQRAVVRADAALDAADRLGDDDRRDHGSPFLPVPVQQSCGQRTLRGSSAASTAGLGAERVQVPSFGSSAGHARLTSDKQPAVGAPSSQELAGDARPRMPSGRRLSGVRVVRLSQSSVRATRVNGSAGDQGNPLACRPVMTDRHAVLMAGGTLEIATASSPGGIGQCPPAGGSGHVVQHGRKARSIAGRGRPWVTDRQAWPDRRRRRDRARCRPGVGPPRWQPNDRWDTRQPRRPDGRWRRG